MNLFKTLQTGPQLAGFICRLTLALVIWPHGLQMVFGWFDGHGFEGTMSYFTGTVGLNWFVGLLVILIQFLGPLLLLVGLGVRPVSMFIMMLFIGMILTAHWEVGFFMNWFGNQDGEGFEYHLLVIGLSMVLMAEGGGKFSLDQYLYNYRFSQQ